MDPKAMRVKRSIPSPEERPHGPFMHVGSMRLADTGPGKIHKLDPESGDLLQGINVPGPEVRCTTLRDGLTRFCCAETRRVCAVALPVRHRNR